MKKAILVIALAGMLMLGVGNDANAGGGGSGGTWYKCARITGCKYKVKYTGGIRYAIVGTRVSTISATLIGGGWVQVY